MAQASSTQDHGEIKRWVEDRKGHVGLLRIDFGDPDESLDAVSWDEFFDTFDRNNLVFLYQEKTASGPKNRFDKFIDAQSASGST